MASENKTTVHPKTGNLIVYGRLAWPSLFTPSKMKGAGDDQKAKFQATVLIKSGCDMDAAKKVASEAAVKKFGEVKAKSGNLRSPFRKSEENDRLVEAGLADDYPLYITARSEGKPGVVGPNGKAVEDPEQVYSGRWVKVSMQAFGYDTSGNKGVSFGLQNVQLLDNDDPLALGGGRVAAETEFEAVDGAGEEGASSDALFG